MADFKNNSFIHPDETKDIDSVLEQSIVKLTEDYTTPPMIISVDEIPIATLGNFSATVGKAKAKKTFNVTAIAAAALSGKRILKYSVSLPKGKKNVLYVDTEQSRYHCYKALKRIYKMEGLDADFGERIKFISLREYSPATRRNLIDYALRKDGSIGLVIIDGLRDLLVDINNAAESVELINKMMEWTSGKNIHIHCVLHQNKGDNNTRGHLGTELNNKAETILSVEKDPCDQRNSIVRPLHTREQDFTPFTFTINNEGLPELVEKVIDEIMTRNMNTHDFTYENLTLDDHVNAMRIAFKDGTIKCSHEEMKKRLRNAYCTIGFARGISVMDKLLRKLKDAGIIIREDKEYKYVEPQL